MTSLSWFSLHHGRLVLSGLLFEVVWLVCVLAPGTGTVALITFSNLVFQCWMFHWRGRAKGFEQGLFRTLRWVAFVAVSGCVMDATLFDVGVFASGAEYTLLPLWLGFLWVNFALALRFAFSFLQRNLWVAAVLGMVGGPLSYLLGAKINSDVILAEPLLSTLVILAGLWGVFLPLIMRCARLELFRQ